MCACREDWRKRRVRGERASVRACVGVKKIVANVIVMSEHLKNKINFRRREIEQRRVEAHDTRRRGGMPSDSKDYSSRRRRHVRATLHISHAPPRARTHTHQHRRHSKVLHSTVQYKRTAKFRLSTSCLSNIRACMAKKLRVGSAMANATRQYTAVGMVMLEELLTRD